jgi:hypothetical protein
MAQIEATRRRSAFRKTQGLGRSAAPRRRKISREIVTARTNRAGESAQQRHDDRGDRIAMCDEPRGDAVDEQRDKGSADGRRPKAEEDRATECVGELLDGHAAEPPVEPFHRGNHGRGKGDHTQDEADSYCRAGGRLPYAGAVRCGDLEAAAQPSACEHRRDHQR